MKKIFTLYNPIYQGIFNGHNVFEIKNMEDVYNIIHQNWKVGKSQVRFDCEEDDDLEQYYIVRLVNKVGETFAWVGYINFNPWF
jgi:hypothetical protein